MEIRISKANKQDWYELTHLRAADGWEFSSDVRDTFIEDAIVLRVDGKLMAYLVYGLYVIFYVDVISSARGKGYGTMLWNWYKKNAREVHEEIEIEAVPSSVPFWKKNGFVVADDEDFGGDFVLMTFND